MPSQASTVTAHGPVTPTNLIPKNKSPPFTETQFFLLFTFGLLGVAAATGAYTLLATLNAVRVAVYPQFASWLTDTAVALYGTGFVLAVALTLGTGWTSPGAATKGNHCCALLCLLMAAFCQFVTGVAGAVLLLLYAVGIGLLEGIVLPAAFYCGSRTSVSANVAVSTGMALSGVLSLATWFLLCHAVFGYRKEDVNKALWVLASLAALSCLASNACFKFIVAARKRDNPGLNDPYSAVALEDIYKSIKTDSDSFQIAVSPESKNFSSIHLPNTPEPSAQREGQYEKAYTQPDRPKGSSTTNLSSDRSGAGNSLAAKAPFSYEKLPTAAVRASNPSVTPLENEGIMVVLRTSYKMVATQFACYFITFCLYPNVGPLSWGRTDIQTDLLTVVYVVADTLGRYTPNLRSWVPQIMLPRLLVQWFVVARVALLVLGCLAHRYRSTTFFGNFWYQFALLSLWGMSHGLISSLAMVYLSQSVHTAKAKSTVSSLGVLSLALGVAVGTWSSRLLKIGDY